MKRIALAGGVAALALTSSLVLAQGQPEDLLPPGFDNPAPSPSPSPTPRPTPTSGSGSEGPASPSTSQGEIVQPVPAAPAPPPPDLGRLPTLEELEAMSTDELDELLGLRPRFDIPPAARRSMARVGVIAPAEGGLAGASLARQPASLVRAALAGIDGPLVSRWGHILLRRALASRLAAPQGMNPVEFAALRAGVLNRMGEHAVARALVQDVDSGNFNDALLREAVDAYIGTADIVGACPAVRVAEVDREDPQWRMLGGICSAYAGEETRGMNDLRRVLNSGSAERIDALLAQRYAGAAGEGRGAVTIEWDEVEELTPWRFALANAVGEPIPDELLADSGPYYRRIAATAPMLPLPQRAQNAYLAASEGIISSSAMVDLFSMIAAAGEGGNPPAETAARLREAYVGDVPANRLAAIRSIWGDDVAGNYGRLVLTAYAAARLPASDEFAEDAAPLIASMLTAGLDRDALRWGPVVPSGSQGWALLALAQPRRDQPVTDGQMGDFVGDDESDGSAKSKMLLAGLAGLGRIEPEEIAEYSGELGIDLARQSRWTSAISQAAEAENPALVAFLAGLGMQGSSWDRMTALHLFHIVRALDRVGMSAEARMIAAEAVARA